MRPPIRGRCLRERQLRGAWRGALRLGMLWPTLLCEFRHRARGRGLLMSYVRSLAHHLGWLGMQRHGADPRLLVRRVNEDER